MSAPVTVRVFFDCPAHGPGEADGRDAAFCAQLPRQQWPEGVTNPNRRVARCRTCIDHVEHFPDARAMYYRARTVHHRERGEFATKCGARCRGARRKDCDCQCGGQFHGAGG